jgi:hypothetical protein
MLNRNDTQSSTRREILRRLIVSFNSEDALLTTTAFPEGYLLDANILNAIRIPP